MMHIRHRTPPPVRATLASVLLAGCAHEPAKVGIEERYRAWGWPATVIFSPDGEELGKIPRLRAAR